MKKAGPILGHVEAEYRFTAILVRAAKEFSEADAEWVKADHEVKADKESLKAGRALFAAQARRTEAGVILLVIAGALLEKIMWEYATTFLDEDWYEENLGTLKIVTKYLALPKICQNKDIAHDDPAIISLREFVRARNAVVHPKRKSFSETSSKRVETEVNRFIQVCRKVQPTVNALIKILGAPAPKR